ncbi:hypothetical protein EIP91_000247 [Steccherinum ochraceum]|uniref:glutathione transferase n=1 Tax=Steccherinum ochraceum TaxID=92696 RepID=A0A4R0RIN5_9APHY|nr:hypothetical protein EIP91_000247 [Steccherinum ochraceum]
MLGIQIFGVPLSVSVRRALIALKELSVPYELLTVNFFEGQQKLPENVQHHPFGEVPYIHDLDTGMTLFESRAIARYIVDKYDRERSSGLLPRDDDIVEKALFEQAVSMEMTRFEPAAYALTKELVFKPVYRKVANDEAEAAKGLAALSKVLNVYEGILSKQQYLAGDHVTLADLFHLPLGTALTDLGKSDVMTTDKRPNVQRWWNSIYSRPSWTAIKTDMFPLK